MAEIQGDSEICHHHKQLFIFLCSLLVPAPHKKFHLTKRNYSIGTAFTKAENTGETVVSEEIDSTSTPKEEANDSDTESADHSEETTAATATAAIIIQSAVKEESNNESGEQKDEDTSEEESSSFRTDSTEPAESDETTATTIEKISKVLTRKLKKLRTNSGAVDFGDHPKSLNQKKLKVNFSNSDWGCLSSEGPEILNFQKDVDYEFLL